MANISMEAPKSKMDVLLDATDHTIDPQVYKDRFADFLQRLREPDLLMECFMESAHNSPVFSRINAFVSTVTSSQDQLQIMEALSSVWSRLQLCVLEKASTSKVLRVKEGEEISVDEFPLGPNSIVHAWFGPVDEELPETTKDRGNVVTQILRSLLSEEASILASSTTFGDSAPGLDKELVIEVELQTQESATVVANVKPPGLNSAGLLCQSSWIAGGLAVALPLFDSGLPKDKRGVSMLPHQHPMQNVEADKLGKQQRIRDGRSVWITSKVCDRCMDPIYDRVFFQCSEACDVDFCLTCQTELQDVMQQFIAKEGVDKPEDFISERMMWIVHTIDEFSMRVLHLDADQRLKLAQLLAFDWPDDLFRQLVAAVVDVCNAKLLFNCTSGALATCVSHKISPAGKTQYSVEALPLYQDGSYQFWYTIGFLQFLYECSGLVHQDQVLDGDERRERKIPIESFILEGINKCNPNVEWQQWERVGSPTQTFNVLRAEKFQCSSSFRSLVAHNNLLPISFRRQCLVMDIHRQIRVSGHDFLTVEASRDEGALVADICQVFAQTPLRDDDASSRGDSPRRDPTHRFLRPLRVSFRGEEYRRGVAARGPGVTREFFQVALRACLAQLFVSTGKRTYWFGNVNWPEAFFACGVLLGQVLLHAERIPNVFPWPLYDLLLQDLGSPSASSKLTLQHLAAVSQEEADSLGKVLEAEGDTITELFGDLGWERVPCLEGRVLTQATKCEFIDAYVEWSFRQKIEDFYGPMSAGFRAVLGSSLMVQKMVDAKQLERIVCGGEVPIDLAAIRLKTSLQDWTDEDQDYIDSFWSVLTEFTEDAKARFVVFVTGSDRVPLNGWEELRVKIQKNGVDDDRLPTAYTCFSLVLLPKYSSVDILRRRMLSAVSESQGFGLQ